MSKLPEGFRPLIGTEEVKIDGKGRVLFSKPKRDRLQDGFTLVLGKSGGICLYPQAIFDQLFEEIFSVETMNSAREEYTRFVLANAHDDVEFDPQGRLVIPARLRKEAGLVDDVLIIGCGDRIELWDREEWVKFNFAPEKYKPERREAIETAYTRMLFGRRAEVREESA